MEHLFSYKWHLTDLANIKSNGYKVFSTFCCGGGSSLGYKLAGFNVLGGLDIDNKVLEHYKTNLNPKYAINKPIQDFTDIPEELYDLDILDGSPPCTLFSVENKKRFELRGIEKTFKEGNYKQVIDTLFFDFIRLTNKLRPKIVIAENVKGILNKGTKEKYHDEILKGFNDIGYHINYFVVNGKNMGVPSSRTRVIYIGFRKDLWKEYPDFDMAFNENEIRSGDFISIGKPSKIIPTRFDDHILNTEKCFPCVTVNTRFFIDENNLINEKDIINAMSFPQDYYFKNITTMKYILGMSVPPIMMAQIATRILKVLEAKNNEA